MKKLSIIILSVFIFASCETSEGAKFGLLQKVSHKTFPCDYYEIQVAYEGGKMVGAADKASYENSQDIKVDKAAFDTLQKYIGDHVVFDYSDGGVAMCGSSKSLSSIRIKQK